MFKLSENATQHYLMEIQMKDNSQHRLQKVKLRAWLVSTWYIVNRQTRRSLTRAKIFCH